MCVFLWGLTVYRKLNSISIRVEITNQKRDGKNFKNVHAMY